MHEDSGNFFAAKAGNVRLSFFAGYEKPVASEDPQTGVSLIFRTEDLSASAIELEAKGVKPLGEVIDIPNFHKFLEYEDPDGNKLFLAEYNSETKKKKNFRYLIKLIILTKMSIFVNMRAFQNVL